ncbi:MAG: cytochrome b5 domain-containing protein [Actinomycetes bacterium]
MRKFLTAVLALLVLSSGVAHAHQPVILLGTDTTAAKGPLLVDGTISFAVRAAFTKAGEKRAFRAQLNQGDALSVQYLIVDKKPERALRISKLPALVITDPTGSKIKVKLNERTKFYEPYGKVNYLYLARYQAVAKSGVYNFVARSKGKAAITIAVGDKEVTGEVLRGNAPAPEPTVSATPTPTPTASATPAGYTMAKVRANNSTASCWSAINGNVYDLTKWINSHPGGSGPIIGLCGTDGSAEFAAKHEGQSKPESRLSGYLLGPLAK